MFGLELVDILYAIAAILLAVAAHRLARQMRTGTANAAPANESPTDAVSTGAPARMN